MEVWVRYGPLFGLSPGTVDEEGLFICLLLPSIGCCWLLATLMTAKFDMRPLANPGCLVAVRRSPERLYECLLFL